MSFILKKDIDSYDHDSIIKVWDNVLPDTVARDLNKEIATSHEWSLKREHVTENDYGYLNWNNNVWGINIGGAGLPQDHPSNQLKHFRSIEADVWKKWPRIKILWNSIKKLCPQYELECSRVWALGTRTMGGSLHTDMVTKFFEEVPGITFIYYAVDEWKIEWDGATHIFNNGEILKSVLPKTNRLIAFDPRLQHKASAISRKCSTLRTVITFHARLPKEKINE